MLEPAKQLLPNIGALILAFLVWLELKTGVVLAFFALYDKHPHFIYILFLSISVGALYRLVRFFLRRQRTPKPAEVFSSSPYRHRRKETPMFPPGMEFNQVQERWRRGYGEAIRGAAGIWGLQTGGGASRAETAIQRSYKYLTTGAVEETASECDVWKIRVELECRQRYVVVYGQA